VWRYSKYLTVSEDFIPVFSEEADKNMKDNWKAFIPHTHMKELLEKLIIALERSHSKDKLNLWLTGAYGTGKTYASFVIKHLLEDPIEEIENYVLRHDLLSPLWPRLKALRSTNPYLVIYHSSSGQITTARRLMIEIQQAIKNRLRDYGYTSVFSSSIMDQLVNKLNDSREILNWENIFKEHRGRFRTAASPAEVIERLQAGDVAMGEQVAEALEEEGITLIDSPGDVKAWIREVISANNLQGIVFIWDEFTEFFANNVGVTPLQELAQATADMPFYLFLITHRAVSQFGRIDDDTRKKLMDRFHSCRLEMNPVTAYRLIANVIEANPDLRDDWDAKQNSLWSQVDVAALDIDLLGEQVRRAELKSLAPIHPISAYLLANISSLYSSSQRTFFRFLKEKETGSFQWFITNYPSDNWYWLTPDYLWLYFFEKTKIEDVEKISDVLNHYSLVKDRLNPDELRVFRVAMLLIALQRQTQSVSTLLNPRRSVIKRMFLGTPLYNRVEEITEKLVSKEIILSISSGNDYEYMIPTATIDSEKMQQYQDKAWHSLKMERMISSENPDAEFAARLEELLMLQGAAKLRHPIRIVSGKLLKNRPEHVIRGAKKPYQIGVILVVAQEDNDLIDTELIAKEITKDHRDYCILISQMAFGSKRWREWIEFKAKSWYYEEMRDNNMKRYYSTKAENTVAEWINAIRKSEVRAFFRGEEERLSGCTAILDYLDELAEIVFPEGPENIDKTATLYTNPWGKVGAEIGLHIATNIQRPYRHVVEELERKGLWDEDGLNRHSSHPVVKMKKEIDDIFARNDSVNIYRLWTRMQQPPYGLMPSPIGILLFAFLLRSYATGYYYSDGVNSLALNPNKLAELVHEVLKGTGSFEDYTIRKMSTEGEQFCEIARDVFHLTPQQAAYPEEARKSMIASIIGLGYPLWTVIYYAQAIYQSDMIENVGKAVASLGRALVYDRSELNDSEMKAIVDAVQPVRDPLSRCLSRDLMRTGMRRFWILHAPKLQTLGEAIGLDETKIMTRLRSLLNEDVNMWDENRVKEKLPIVVKELDLLDAMNMLCETRKQDLSTIRDYFITHWFNSKFPLLSHKEGQPDHIARLVDYVYELVYHPDQLPNENLADDIREFKDQLSIALKSVVPITGMLAEKFTGQKISEQEASELYRTLPNLSNATSAEVREAILRTLPQQTRHKKMDYIRQSWKDHTGFESPASWSEEMRTPIQWVLEGEAHNAFFSQYDRLEQLPEHELDQAIAYLSRHLSELAVLNDNDYVLDRFVQAAAGDYAALIRQSGNASDVRDYVYRSFDGKVYQWPLRLSEVNQKVRQWVHENYYSSAYPKLIRLIDEMPPNSVKNVIKQLISKDALVGIRLMTAIKDKS